MFLKRYYYGLACTIGMALLPQYALAWGFWAHQQLNRLAIYTLPPEMILLYKPHLEFLTAHAVDPDKRRYAVEGEAARHYIDLDHYGVYPFEALPRSWYEACDSLGRDSLEAYGILPYHVPRVVQRLVKAFKEGNLTRILKLSADLGHYLGDAHVPLHTTQNYNGQLTGQKGIHGFWESRLPELFAGEYDFFVGQAYLLTDPKTEIWTAVMESHLALDSVLLFERELNDHFSAAQKYGYETRNNVVIRTYSRPYARAYHEMLAGMVERRMRQSIRRIGSFWYTAWRLAGSPDLKPLLRQRPKVKPWQGQKKLKIRDRENQDLGCLPARPKGRMPHLHRQRWHLCLRRLSSEKRS